MLTHVTKSPLLGLILTHKSIAGFYPGGSNTCVLRPFEEKGHGFFNGRLFRKKNTDEDLHVTMTKSMAFLKDIGFVKVKRGAEDR